MRPGRSVWYRRHGSWVSDRAIATGRPPSLKLVPIYRQFWRWSDNTLDHAMLCGWQSTVFGWRNWVFPSPNPRSIRNFHMQASGAEMLRLACCLGTENGIRICAPVHDAVLITAPIPQLVADIAAMHHYMEQASTVV